MKLYRIILPVGNIEKAAQFYSSLLGMSGERVSPGRHYFNLEGTILACYDPKADGDDGDPQWKMHDNQYIYIAVDNLEETFQTLQGLNPLMMDDTIEKMPWGERLFYLNDPWGNPVCFVERSTIFSGRYI